MNKNNARPKYWKTSLECFRDDDGIRVFHPAEGDCGETIIVSSRCEARSVDDVRRLLAQIGRDAWYMGESLQDHGIDSSYSIEPEDLVDYLFNVSNSIAYALGFMEVHMAEKGEQPEPASIYGDLL